jgi:Na+-driven multidrug efflux pump
MIARYFALGQKANARKLARRLVQVALAVGTAASALTYASASLLAPLMLGEGMELTADVLAMVGETMPLVALQQPLVALTLCAEGLVTGCRAFHWMAGMCVQCVQCAGFPKPILTELVLVPK